jgi:hypothetical protein
LAILEQRSAEYKFYKLREFYLTQSDLLGNRAEARQQLIEITLDALKMQDDDADNDTAEVSAAAVEAPASRPRRFFSDYSLLGSEATVRRVFSESVLRQEPYARQRPATAADAWLLAAAPFFEPAPAPEPQAPLRVAAVEAAAKAPRRRRYVQVAKGAEKRPMRRAPPGLGWKQRAPPNNNNNNSRRSAPLAAAYEETY